MRWMVVLVALTLAGCVDVRAPDLEPESSKAEPRVVTATFDTGTNPFHPCFRRDVSAWEAIPELVGQAESLNLSFEATYEESLEASQPALDAIQDHTLYVVEGTNLLFYGANNAAEEFVDTYPHGAQASSQIVCEEYGMAPDAFLVILNWYDTRADAHDLMNWAAEQSWIDVIHLNIQRNTPSLVGSEASDHMNHMISNGQFVVVAAGNGVNNGLAPLPGETIDYNAVHGVYVAGASDGEGYTQYSSMDPHTVMDGCRTEAAAPDNFESRSFSGTSSASPRTTGYASELLRQLRLAVGHEGGRHGTALVEAEGIAAGPLADGVLDAVELHEVLRKTADPALAASPYDGEMCTSGSRGSLPDGKDYSRVGYGKLTEATFEVALAVLLGEAPMPDRAEADGHYDRSNMIRDAYWSLVG